MSSLSSNWKALQESLKKGERKGKGESNKKRPSPTTEAAPREAKRPKETSSSVASTAPSVSPILALFPKASDAQKQKVGQFVAIDCEMVGCGTEGMVNSLARVAIVNFHGAVLLDSFVRPPLPVTDYRTHITGITPKELKDAPTLQNVLTRIDEVIRDKMIVGHGLKNDFKVIFHTPPAVSVRDTSRYKPFKALNGDRTPSLRFLAGAVLGLASGFQDGSHDAVEDARVAMLLYRKVRTQWEAHKRAKALRKQRKEALKAQKRLRREEAAAAHQQQSQPSDSD